MTLKKTIASFLKPDGTWEPQKDIEVHPLEEAELRAHWAIHDVTAQIPEKPTREQEHEWLIEHGTDYIKQRRAEWQAVNDSIQPHLKAAEQAHLAAHQVWCTHVENCIVNKIDPNKH